MRKTYIMKERQRRIYHFVVVVISIPETKSNKNNKIIQCLASYHFSLPRKYCKNAKLRVGRRGRVFLHAYAALSFVLPIMYLLRATSGTSFQVHSIESYPKFYALTLPTSLVLSVALNIMDIFATDQPRVALAKMRIRYWAQNACTVGWLFFRVLSSARPPDTRRH